MSKIEEIVVLREYLGLSWWQIAKTLYPNVRDRKELAKKALSIYGQYKKYKQRREKEYAVNSNMQGEELEYGHPGFSHLQHVLVKTLPGTASYKELKKGADKRERHKYELLELIDFFYNAVGLANSDRERFWLFALHKTALLVMKHVDIERANAQHVNSYRRSASVTALAFVYVTFELTLSNTPFYSYLRNVWQVMLNFLPSNAKRRERKLEELVEAIAELEKSVTRYRLAQVAYI